MRLKLKIVGLFLSLLPLMASSDPGGVKINIKYFQVPILKELEYNPVIRVKIETDEIVKLKSLKLNLNLSTDLNDIKILGLYFSGKDSVFRKNRPLAILSEAKENLNFKTKQKIDVGETYLWISIELIAHANLMNRLGLKIEEISFRKIGDVPIVQEEPPLPLRYGLALRQHGQDNVNTTRIPGLATSENGTLMAVYDARRASGRDLQGDIDIGLNRSFDGGNTWEPLQIVMDMGTWGGLPQKFNGVSDANILVNGNEIFIAGAHFQSSCRRQG